MTIKDEFQFISRIRQNEVRQSGLVEGIGDDAALYVTKSDYLEVVCTDTLVEGVHFLKELSSPKDIGYKGLAVNVSDVAAMGGVPKYYLVAIAVPKSWSEQELAELYAGMDELAEPLRIDLIGGDTVSTSDKLVLTVTVIGEVKKGRQRLRKDARPGDAVFVTGTVGDSAAGLQVLLGNLQTEDPHAASFLINRHKRPVPQVKAGQIMSSANRVSLNDISDGLASELNEICESSCVKIVIDKTRLPMSDSMKSLNHEDSEKWMLFGGEDFELTGTASRAVFTDLQKRCLAEGILLTEIGRVEEGPAGVFFTEDGKLTKLEKSGYNHFK